MKPVQSKTPMPWTPIVTIEVDVEDIVSDQAVCSECEHEIMSHMYMGSGALCRELTVLGDKCHCDVGLDDDPFSKNPTPPPRAGIRPEAFELFKDTGTD